MTDQSVESAATSAGFDSEAPGWLAAERGTETPEQPAVVAAAPEASAEASADASAEAEVVAPPAVAPSAGVAVKASLADVEEAMKDVVDPELGINVVDLGLVYGTFVDDDNVVTIDMTLTSAACPLTDVIEDQTRSALTTGPGGGLVSDFRINWVWLPPWGPDKITDDGREQLRALGFNV